MSLFKGLVVILTVRVINKVVRIVDWSLAVFVESVSVSPLEKHLFARSEVLVAKGMHHTEVKASVAIHIDGIYIASPAQ